MSYIKVPSQPVSPIIKQATDSKAAYIQKIAETVEAGINKRTGKFYTDRFTVKHGRRNESTTVTVTEINNYGEISGINPFEVLVALRVIDGETKAVEFSYLHTQITASTPEYHNHVEGTNYSVTAGNHTRIIRETMTDGYDSGFSVITSQGLIATISKYISLAIMGELQYL